MVTLEDRNRWRVWDRSWWRNHRNAHFKGFFIKAAAFFMMIRVVVRRTRSAPRINDI
jgi:hypothetical protein